MAHDLNEHPNAERAFARFAADINYVPLALTADTLRQERMRTMARAYRESDAEGEEDGLTWDNDHDGHG